MNAHLAGSGLTFLAGLCCMASALSLLTRWLLSKHDFPNYPSATKTQRFWMAALGVGMAGLGAYRLNNAFDGSFRADLPGCFLAALFAGYFVSSAIEVLRSRLPAYFYQRIERAKTIARCSRNKTRNTAIATLELEGMPVALPGQMPHEVPALCGTCGDKPSVLH